MGSKAGEGLGEHGLQGETEGSGAVQCGEEEAEGRPDCSAPVSERGLQQSRAALFSLLTGPGGGETASSCARGGLGWMSGGTCVQKGL